MKTTAEAARLLGISQRRVNELIHEGRLQATRSGGIWLIDDDSIEERRLLGEQKGGRPRKGSGAHEALFTLMNRTYEVARVIYDERIAAFTTLDGIIDRERIPLGAVNNDGKLSLAAFNDWWRNRGIPSSRTNIEETLKALGASIPDELIMHNLGLSLSDQYWVRPHDADMRWEDINFFTNDFESIELYGEKGESPRHPDNTSDGVLPKHWFVRKGKRLLLKGGAHNNQEPFNEAVSTALHRRLLDESEFVLYRMDEWNGAPASSCENFLTSQEEFIPAQYAIRIREQPAHASDFRHFIDCCEELGIDGAEGFISRMIVCDDTLANTDRHLRNFGVIRNVETLECRMAPLFDSGTCLWCDASLIDLEHGDFAFSSKPFNPRPVQQFQLADLEWVDIEALDGFVEEAMEILSGNPDIKPRLPHIEEGLKRRVDRLVNIRAYL